MMHAERSLASATSKDRAGAKACSGVITRNSRLWRLPYPEI
jgi:hypothetical protein